MSVRQRLSVFLLIILYLFSNISAAWAEAPVSFSAKDVISRIEKRRGSWTSIKAAVELGFKVAGEEKASCQGTLLYQRLDEAIRLDCFNSSKDLVFILKTEDRNFELYLPARKTLYQGNIFSLEDSPEIESHLRALDLYRALKPMLIPEEDVNVSQEAEGMISMKIMRGDETPSRILHVTNQGDIQGETYYSLEGTPTLDVKRFDFEKIIPAPAAEVEPVFPRRILIESHKKSQGEEQINATEFLFKKIDFSPSLQDKDFELTLPDDIRTLALEDHLDSQ